MTDITAADPRDPAVKPSETTEPTGAGPRVDAQPAPSAAPTAPRQAAGARTPLFDQAATRDLRDRWSDVQAHFVDEPSVAVEQADGLVGDVMQRLTETFKSERQTLESHWSRGDDVSTEDLRLALQRYRSFFDRLLTL